MVRVIISLIFVFFILPYLTGVLIVKLAKSDLYDWKKVFVCGYITTVSLFQLIVIPCVFGRVPLTLVLSVWLITLIVLAVIAIVYYRRKWTNILQKQYKSIRDHIHPMVILFIVLLMIQLFIVIVYTHYDLDDAYYLGIASDAYQSNRMYQVSPYTGAETDLMSQIRYIMSGYEMYVAAIAKMAGIHPTIVFHSIMPAVHLLLIYIIYSLIADVIFAKNSNQKWIFLSLLSVFQLFGYVSVYTSATFTMFRLWQGKAVLAGMVIPLIVYTAMEVMQRDRLVRQWILVLLVQVVACFYTSMGALIAPILLAILALINAIRLRNAKVLLWAFICVIPCLFTDMMYVVLR